MKKLTRDRVVPIISASVSWLTFAMIGSGRPSLPKFARSRSVRARQMSAWFHSLPVAWMALLVFGFTYFVVAVIYVVVRLLAVGERAHAFKSVSPGMLPPLGIVFGLFVGFTAAHGLER
jgi:hypothetical protein